MKCYWLFFLLIVQCQVLPLCSIHAADGATPNVLMIVVDDMNDWVECLGGHLDVNTPNINRLASRGMLFSNAHCAAPVCNPSRVATLTGRRPSSTGIYDNSVVWHEALNEVVTIPQHFRQNGYHVAGGGKVNHHMPGFNRRSDWDEYFDQVFDGHFHIQMSRGGDPKKFAWPDGFPLNRLAAVKSLSKPPQNPPEFDWGPFDQPDNEMGDGQMVNWAVKFLSQPPKVPFFLTTGIYRPHLPFYAPRKYFEMYSQDSIALPPLKADDLEDLPQAGRAMSEQRRGDYELVMREGRHREIIQAYLANITFADALIGELLDAVDRNPENRNTIIVLWSDHGWHLGEKQHLHKFTLWERSTRVPFLVSVPGVTNPNSRCTSPVGLVDLFPTLTELCSLPSVDGIDGVSLVPLLRDPNHVWDRPALTTHGAGNHSLRTDRWRYIRYADHSEELYDHRSDPNEWINLANSKEFASVKQQLAPYFPQTDAKPLSRKKKAR
jgi:arylsulfatase A-like enzyme